MPAIPDGSLQPCSLHIRLTKQFKVDFHKMVLEITRFFHKKAGIPGTISGAYAGGKIATTRVCTALRVPGTESKKVTATVTMCSAHIQSEDFPIHWLEMCYSTSICDETHYSMS